MNKYNVSKQLDQQCNMNKCNVCGPLGSGRGLVFTVLDSGL